MAGGVAWRLCRQSMQARLRIFTQQRSRWLDSAASPSVRWGKGSLSGDGGGRHSCERERVRSAEREREREREMTDRRHGMLVIPAHCFLAPASDLPCSSCPLTLSTAAAPSR
ncbi:uncharacterized protein K452DRAFT_60453 [Aplosporella prunicola CBS 121167]|uniref:Uncharacterized protein n=1 Tax=Aplosporella prunicola CBS 121167 TaxID=1176127 RepID=A0A6A6B9N8_9PEZI|nr:uncharacterized protein K452DRAFT_60453 [Aplosporella prunicola CBS 121167]KAF2140073.1 hypothetical protein K452DRAFT_60453 [Aplosporella prunicola CBS 121167]